MSTYVRVQGCSHKHEQPTEIDVIIGQSGRGEETAACLSIPAARLLMMVLARAIAAAEGEHDRKLLLH